MQKIHRLKQAALLILLALILSCHQSANKANTVWTAAYMQNLHDGLDQQMKARLPNDSSRHDLIQYIITHLRDTLPTGLESISPDSLNHLSEEIGKYYAYTHQHHEGKELIPVLVPWTARREQLFNKMLTDAFSSEDAVKQGVLCKCVLAKIKKIYPDSVLLPIPQHIITDATIRCYNLYVK